MHSSTLSICPPSQAPLHWGTATCASGQTYFMTTPEVGRKTLETRPTRFAHVIMRAKERGGLDIDAAKLLTIENKIRLVRKSSSEGKQVSPILPTTTDGRYYSVLISGTRHVFVYGRKVGIISYARPDKQEAAK